MPSKHFKGRNKIHALLEGTENQALCSEINDPRVKRAFTKVMSEVNCQMCLSKLARKRQEKRDIINTELNLAKLPAFVYARHPLNKRTVLITLGKTGFDYVQSALTWEQLNAANCPEATPSQVRAMVAGSIFGWHTPLANPDHDAHKDPATA
jgi:hypothetical protein